MRYRTSSIVETASFVVAAVGGMLAALAPVAWPGLVLGGSACGGGNEQVCRGLARQLSLVEVGEAAWL